MSAVVLPDRLPDADVVRTQLDRLAAELGLELSARKDGRVALVRADGTAIAPWRDNYLRRYLPHLPMPGEIVMFDRSWYNRAGVEHVMGFCQPDEYARFLADVPDFENGLIADGIKVIKLWFSITRAEQLRRFIDRHADPVKSWKLSAIDLASLDKWDEYTKAKEAMFRHTDLPDAPWTVVKGNDKKRARLEVMRHVLSLFDYGDKRPEIACAPDPLIAWPAARLPEPMFDDDAPIARQAPMNSVDQRLLATAR